MGYKIDAAFFMLLIYVPWIVNGIVKGQLEKLREDIRKDIGGDIKHQIELHEIRTK